MFKSFASVPRPGASRPNVSDPAFVIQHARQDAKPDGRFTPAAMVALTPHLRTSGLLAALPGEEIKSLLCVLTFVTANGRIEPSLPEVAGALNVPESKARDRLLRLQTFLWQGEPLLRSRQRELGLDVYLPAARLLGTRREEEAPSSVEPLRITGHREAIVAHSRAAYTRPRAEVEQIIAEQLGHSAVAHAAENIDTPQGQARQRLRAIGVPSDYIERLLNSHPIEIITEQLDWLGHRYAKNPARLIVAAIENRYEPPARVRLERAIAAEAHEEEDAAKSVPEPVAEMAGVSEDELSEPGQVVTLTVPPLPEESKVEDKDPVQQHAS